MTRLLSLLAVGWLGTLSALAAPKPNLVVILVDDMGFSDLSCYGSEIPTPNLDGLARGGLRFTQFHNTARCCPSRAALLTGLYPHQAGVGHMMEERKGPGGQVLPGYTGRLNDRCVTIAEALQGAGYFTAMSGKWHLGQEHGVTPPNRGFQRSLHAPAGGFYFPEGANASLFLNGKALHRRDEPLPHDWYSTDLFTDYALKFVDEARAAEKPFFLYLAYNAPHFPLQAPAAEIAAWRGKYRAGWDVLRQTRYRRQVEMGLIEAGWPLSPRPPEVPAWDSLSPAEHERYDHIMAIYAAVVAHMDAAVGTLVEGLRARGALENTLLLFMSDNGGNAESGPRGRLEGADPGSAGSTVFEGQSWATLSNTPFVRYKHFTDEGGIATPLIAHWPQGIPAERAGGFERQPGHLIDILPTCLAAAGAAYPTEYGGHAIQPAEGTSLLPALAGQPLARTQPLFWEHEGNRAVREGTWKLVARAGEAWRLYDTTADRTEQHDLATAEPERAAALAAHWEAYAARANVLPMKPENENTPGSAAPTFTLAAGAHLQKDEAPALAHRSFTLTARYSGAAEGVLVAQGGSAQGYALYGKEGKLTFAVRHKEELHQVTVEAPAGEHTATAVLSPEGQLTLALEGTAAVKGPAAGLFKNQPVDGLDVGVDRGAAVGSYTGENPFQGKIESITLRFGPPAALVPEP